MPRYVTIVLSLRRAVWRRHASRHCTASLCVADSSDHAWAIHHFAKFKSNKAHVEKDGFFYGTTKSGGA